MSELGTQLKEARIAKGYSLEDLQDVTKIQKRYLVGIEEGNHSMMPGPFYARAFIKQYAEAVGLNAVELLEQHKGEVPSPPKEEVRTSMVPPTPSRRQTFAKSSSRGSNMGEVMPKIIVALFIVVIIGVAWVFYNSLGSNNAVDDVPEETGVPYEQPEEKTEPKEEPADEEKAEEPPAEPEQPAEPEVSIEKGATEGETTTYTFSGPEKREMIVKANGASWVAATDQDQKALFPGTTMQPDDSETVDVSQMSQVRLRLGAAPNMSISINGKPVEISSERITQNIVIQFTEAE